MENRKSITNSLISTEYIHNPQHEDNPEAESTPAIEREEEQQAPPVKERLMSLDAYRGLTVFGMIVADQTYKIEGACWWLIHPKWNGLTFADLVFPAFLFIMGVAIPLAVSKNRPLKPKNIVRVFALFLIGVLLNFIKRFDLSTLRIMGILQRLSICYGLNLLIHWLTNYGTNVKAKIIAGLVSAGSVIAYVFLMLTWEDENIGCYKSNNLDPFCNFAGYVDRAVFTQSHILEYTDPEGLISTITASFTTYVGYNFGLMVVKMKDTPLRLIKYWVIIAVVFGAAIYPSYLLMPFNKRLYTITFLFTNLSSCSLALSLFIFLVDALPKKYPSTRAKILTVIQPLTWLGLNPLAIFILLQILYSNMMKGDWFKWGQGSTPYTALYEAAFSWMGPYFGTMLYTLLYGVVLTLVGGLLYRFKIFIRL